jgi:hypothetical protein
MFFFHLIFGRFLTFRLPSPPRRPCSSVLAMTHALTLAPALTLILALAAALSLRPCRHRTAPIARSVSLSWLPTLFLALHRSSSHHHSAAFTLTPPSPSLWLFTSLVVIVLHSAPVMVITVEHSIECAVVGM